MTIFIMVEFIARGFGHHIVAHKIYIYFFQHNKGLYGVCLLEKCLKTQLNLLIFPLKSL